MILDPQVQSSAALDNGFYCSLFVKVKNKRPVCAVMAIRGTANLDNLKVDVRSWWLAFLKDDSRVSMPEDYIQQAVQFYNKMQRYCSEKLKLSSRQMFVTGHSLGGALSGLLPTYYGFPIRAVTFNAPGIRAVNGIKMLWHRVINVRASYDFVSSIGSPIGVQMNVPVPEHESQAKTAFMLYRFREKHTVLAALSIGSEFAKDASFLVSAYPQHSITNLTRAMNAMACTDAGRLLAMDAFGLSKDNVESLLSKQNNKPYDRLHPFQEQRQAG